MSTSRNAVYNVVGAALPSVLTLVTVPLYLRVVGVERYGILTLCWVMLGYAGFLDFGLGLAVARRVAAARDEAPPVLREIFWTSLWISLVTATFASVVIYTGSAIYFHRVAHVTTSFANEVGLAIPLVVASVPIAMVGGVLGGVLTGRERFLTLNVVSTVALLLVSALPLIVAFTWKPTLVALVAGALAGRAAPLPWMYWLCRRELALGAPAKPSVPLARELLGFGGWLALSTFANGLINTTDRLTIGSRIGPAAVSAYGIAYGVVSRIILIPHSLSGALYPRYAYADAGERERLMASSLQAVAAIITPAIVGVVAVTQPFFTIWIGPALARATTPVAYVLAAGFWVYCLGHMAYSTVQATGRPDRVAKLLLAEIIPYLAALFFGMWAFGLPGAAGAFTLRATVDCGFQLRLAAVPLSAIRRLLIPAALVVGSISAAAAITGPFRYAALLVILATSVAWSAANIPDVLRPLLRRFGSRVLGPFARTASR